MERGLRDSPDEPARKRKILVNLVTDFGYAPPLWQLRVGDFRVFYDLDEASRSVRVRAVRRKPPHATTEEIVE